MIIHYSRTFRKNFRSLSAAEQAQVEETVATFKKNPFDVALRNHKLKGVQKGIRSISAGHDLRLLYVEKNGHALILFIRLGSHEDVYE